MPMLKTTRLIEEFTDLKPGGDHTIGEAVDCHIGKALEAGQMLASVEIHFEPTEFQQLLKQHHAGFSEATMATPRRK